MAAAFLDRRFCRLSIGRRDKLSFDVIDEVTDEFQTTRWRAHDPLESTKDIPAKALWSLGLDLNKQ